MVSLKTVGNAALDTAGVAQRLTETSAIATTIVLQADATNTNNVYIGDENVSASDYGIALTPGQILSITADMSGRAGGEEFDVKDIYFDGDTTGNQVRIAIIARK
jgi:hypothetical protein